MEFRIRITKNTNLTAASVIVLRGIAMCTGDLISNPNIEVIDFFICDDIGEFNGIRYSQHELRNFDSIFIELVNSDRLINVNKKKITNIIRSLARYRTCS